MLNNFVSWIILNNHLRNFRHSWWNFPHWQKLRFYWGNFQKFHWQIFHWRNTMESHKWFSFNGQMLFLWKPYIHISNSVLEVGGYISRNTSLTKYKEVQKNKRSEIEHKILHISFYDFGITKSEKWRLARIWITFLQPRMTILS